MPTLYNQRATPLTQSSTNPLAESMRLAYDFTGIGALPFGQPYDFVGTNPPFTVNSTPDFVTFNDIPGRRAVVNSPFSLIVNSDTDYGTQVGLGDFTVCVLASLPASLPTANVSDTFMRIDDGGSSAIAVMGVAGDISAGWFCLIAGAGGTVSGQGRAIMPANRAVALFYRRQAGVTSGWRVLLGVDGTALRVVSDSSTGSAAMSLNGSTAKRLQLFSTTNPANSSALQGFRLHNVALTEAEMFTYANDWFALDTLPSDTTAPTLSLATATAVTFSTATGGVTTNEAGPGWAVLSTSATAPTAAQIKLGQDHTGAAAAASDTATLTVSANAAAFSFTGLTAATTYYLHTVQDDTATPANTSNVVTNVTGITTPTAPKLASTTLTTDGTTAAASLTGLRWAWWDAAPPNLATAPIISGTTGTTNGSGVFTVTLTGSALSVGQTGTLLVLTSDGTAGSTANKAYCAPVVVS